ncbi:MAG: hypothetical protein AUJ04_05650 [Acidobacteria bacterium 13_1_40CM_3_55_6]|nr:MAG: hypothetical protein AUJ04_05650 [Acidobacteria bacterium 13_1_40CM_3_55_6]
MATSSKKAVKKARPRKSRINLAQYARLRTILDEKLQSALLPIIREIWNRGEGLADCPEGYIDCNGVCVPYQCVGSEF